MATGFFTDELFLEHRTGTHPERPERISVAREHLEKQQYFGRLHTLPRRFASNEELQLVHPADHIARVQAVSERGGGMLDPDTVLSRQSFEAARLAAGAGLSAVDAIQAGQIDRAFLLVRPPGHHALAERAMGFCLFANVAVCARYAQSKGFAKVAIVDWDVHHGNGTEAIFYTDPTVLFTSIHQYPFYPGTGAASDTGTLAGEGFTLNVPMQAGSDDAAYEKKLHEVMLPAIERFEPDLMIISAGFDAHRADPLGGMNLSTNAFARFTQLVLDCATQSSSCKGRVISMLEGGYDLSALAESAEVHLAGLV
jgi:acetoin utilization deacetylase AcuC-like enzyme